MNDPSGLSVMHTTHTALAVLIAQFHDGGSSVIGVAVAVVDDCVWTRVRQFG
jgi:hypothetical protein